MAVLSRPSLRSSAHNDAGPESHVIGATNQSTKPRPAKRTRLPSPSHDSDTSSKKLKTVLSTINRKHSTSNRDALKTLPFRSRQQASTNGVTPDLKTRKLDPVLVQPRSTIFTSSQESVESLHYGINQNIPPPLVDKRSLRSHVGGSRSRSELEPYFSNYEDLISIEPKEIGASMFCHLVADTEACQSSFLPILYFISTMRARRLAPLSQRYLEKGTPKERGHQEPLLIISLWKRYQ